MKKITMFVVALAVLFNTAVITAATALPAVEKTDRFDLLDDENGKQLISLDGELVINVNDEIPVFLENGDPVRAHLARETELTDLLDGKTLTVSYTITTMSMPPQTTPVNIVIMDEDATAEEGPIGIVPPIYIFTPEEIEEFFPMNGEIVVLGELIEAPAPYYNNGVAMLPLRAVAEALGYDIIWNETDRSVNLGRAITVTIGDDYYTVGRMTPIKLGTAPEITEGLTYVPIDFFREVLNEYSAYVFEGQVVIDNMGDMQ